MITSIIIALAIVTAIAFYLYKIATLTEKPSTELDIAKVLYPDPTYTSIEIKKQMNDEVQDLIDFENEELKNNTAFKEGQLVKITDPDETGFLKNMKAFILGFDETDGSYFVGNEFATAWMFVDQLNAVRG